MPVADTDLVLIILPKRTTRILAEIKALPGKQLHAPAAAVERASPGIELGHPGIPPLVGKAGFCAAGLLCHKALSGTGSAPVAVAGAAALLGPERPDAPAGHRTCPMVGPGLPGAVL